MNPDAQAAEYLRHLEIAVNILAEITQKQAERLDLQAQRIEQLRADRAVAEVECNRLQDLVDHYPI